MQTSGLHRWIPQHTGPIWSFDAYDTRSALSTGVVIYCELPHDPHQRNLAAAAVAEYKRLRPALRGEFHLLQSATATPEGWHAFQFHRADTDSGFAVFFRRSSETAARETFGLQGLRSARYEVTYSTDYDRGPVAVRTCSELQHVSITLSEAPSSTLIEYARLDN